MMLRTTNLDHFINTDHIREVYALWNKTHYHFDLRGTFADGTSVVGYSVSQREWGRFRAEAKPVIKAEPGYWELIYSAKIDEVIRWPVLAWQLDLQYGLHCAVTPGLGSPGDDDDYSAILCPGGRVTIPGLENWETEAYWLEDMRVRAQEEKKKAVPAV